VKEFFMDLLGWLIPKQTQPVASEISSFPDIAGIIDKTSKIVSGVVDSGLNVYQTFAEKVAQVRLMNTEISARLNQDAAAQAQKVAVENFFKNYGGILAGGAIGVLFLGLLISRK